MTDHQRDELKLADLAPVESPSPDERDRLVKQLLPTLDADQQQELHGQIMADYQAALDDRQDWEARLETWDDQYYGRLPTKNFPWPGASNLNVPLTMLGVETLKPRLIESVSGGEPIVHVIPVEATDDERRDRTELFLNWQLGTHLGIEDRVAESAHLFLNPGTVVAKVYWRAERSRRRYVRTFPVSTPIDEILQNVLGSQPPSKFESAGSMHWRGELPSSAAGGPPLEFEIRLSVGDDEKLHVRVDKDELDERPWIKLLEPLDFIAPSNAGPDVQRMPWCVERLYMTEDDLRRAVQTHRFSKAAVDALLKTREPQGQDAQLDGSDYRDQQQDVEGVDAFASDARAETYVILEHYRRWDIDDDGFEEEIVAWVSPDLPGELLGWDYLDNVYAHGRRPYRVGRFFPIPFRFYGLSFAEIVRNLQEEINTIHNMRVDSGTLANLPWYLYRGSSTHNPTAYPIRPGTGIPVDNPQNDIVFPRMQFDSQFGQNEEALVYQYFERLTGLTDLALGRQPSRVGATRTATGVASLLSESGLRFKTAMQAFQRFWVGIFEDVLALDQQYLPPGVEFRVTGRLPEYLRLASRADIAGRFDLKLSATTETINKDVMRQDALTLMQLLTSPAGLQLGMVGMKGIRRAYLDLLRAFGKETDLYLEAEPASIVRTPEEELAMLVSGQPIQPSPAENLGAHVQAHMLQRRDSTVQMILGPTGMKALDQHIQQTIQLMQTQQMAQSLQGPRGQAALNPSGAQAQNAMTGKLAPNQAVSTNAGPPAPNTNLPAVPGMAQGAGKQTY